VEWITVSLANRHFILIGDFFSFPISARLTRTVNLTSGVYRFSVIGDDGVRLYVDGQLKIDKCFAQGASTYTATVTLTTSGPHRVSRSTLRGAVLPWCFSPRHL
jgi:hypothetical protein